MRLACVRACVRACVWARARVLVFVWRGGGGLQICGEHPEDARPLPLQGSFVWPCLWLRLCLSVFCFCLSLFLSLSLLLPLPPSLSVCRLISSCGEHSGKHSLSDRRVYTDTVRHKSNRPTPGRRRRPARPGAPTRSAAATLSRRSPHNDAGASSPRSFPDIDGEAAGRLAAVPRPPAASGPGFP